VGIAVCAVMGGAETWVELEAYGRATYEWLKRVLPLPQGIPSHKTCARVLARLEPAAFRLCLLAWLTAVQEQRGGARASPRVAREGEAARHRGDRALDRGPLPRGRAWATAAPVVLGEVAVAQQRHESTALPTGFQLLERSGCVVTIDARGPQQQMAQTMRDQEADDVWALNGHQGTLPEDVARLCEWADAPPDRNLVHRTHETHTTGHGWEERRRTTVPNDRTWRRGYADGGVAERGPG
jgi:predicted transposase YbfD/YdcC